MNLPDSNIVPDPMHSREQWVLWRNEYVEERDEETKVPYSTTNTHADSTDPETWSSFEKACEAAEMIPGIDGVGYMFDPASPIVGVDLDDCVTDGEIDDWAREIIDQLDSYTHYSTSGTGIHIFALGSFPAEEGNRHGDVEMYDKERFFAFTGDHVEGTPEGLEPRSDELTTVWEQYVDTDDSGGENDGSDSDDEVHEVSLEAEEIVKKAKNAEYKKDTFTRLYERGDTSGYPSHSEADSALCCLLAWWTGHDERLMDEIFRDSELMRDKWDEDRGSKTYGEITIEKACKTVTGSYDPDRGSGDEDETEVDPSAFERESTASMKVFSEAVKNVEAGDVDLALDPTGKIEQIGADRWLNTVSGESFDTISLVAWLEGLVDKPTETVEGRADWIELGHALRFRGASVPRFKPTGGVRQSTEKAGWSR